MNPPAARRANNSIGTVLKRPTSTTESQDSASEHIIKIWCGIIVIVILRGSIGWNIDRDFDKSAP